RDERRKVTIRREAGAGGGEALVRGSDARTGRIVHVEVGEEMEPGRQGFDAQHPVAPRGRDEGVFTVGDQEVERVVAPPRLVTQGRGRSARSGGAEQLEAEQSARATR